MKIEGSHLNKRIFLASPHMGGNEMNYIKEAFDTNWVAPLGENVDEFEKEIARYVGAEGAVAMSSGTAAIHMALHAAGVESGDVVFCSSLTFSASANPIIYQGATPVFIDSEPNSWNMSPVALEKAFKKYKPKAVIVVNLYGQSADMEGIINICDQYGATVIEDAAESLGATYKSKKSGTLGKFGIYSFNGNKIITTSGGGMLVSNDLSALKKVKFWITQARDKARYYQHSELGYNYRMSNILAGIGRGQLKVLNERIEKKKRIYINYKEAFESITGIHMMPICDYGQPNFWLSCISIAKDLKINPIDAIMLLENNNIESRPIWKPMHLQPFFEDCDYFKHDYDVSREIFENGLCLPSDTKMTNEEQQCIIKVIEELF